MKHRLLLLAALAMPLAGPAQASPIMILGLGNDSCGKWSEARAKRDDTGPEGMEALTYSIWVRGYLTASQNGFPMIFEPIKRTDSSGMDVWIDNYCQAHPLDTIENAASALVDALIAKYYEQHPPPRRKHG